jgi:pyruvate/2-oxoglutarate dehydrogenase complex dihydrolipoamide acyltransferase (E2) component
MTNTNYKVVPFPATRQIVTDAGRLGVRRHVIHVLLELDVTRARESMRAYRARTGESLSFTAFVVACFARAVDRHKPVHAYRDWRNRLVIFDDVDVVTMIEAERGGVALAHILRAANTRSVFDIHREIRSIQAQPAKSDQHKWLVGIGPRLPAFVRDIFYWALRKSPHWFKRYAGTCILTSVGMFGHGGGWGIGFLPMHTIGLTVGGIAQKPGVVDGQIAIREYLDLTLSFDHDIVDGAPAARFAECLRQLIEDGDGLDASLSG